MDILKLLVFFIGAFFALLSLIATQFIPSIKRAKTSENILKFTFLFFSNLSILILKLNFQLIF